MLFSSGCRGCQPGHTSRASARCSMCLENAVNACANTARGVCEGCGYKFRLHHGLAAARADRGILSTVHRCDALSQARAIVFCRGRPRWQPICPCSVPAKCHAKATAVSVLVREWPAAVPTTYKPPIAGLSSLEPSINSCVWMQAGELRFDAFRACLVAAKKLRKTTYTPRVPREQNNNGTALQLSFNAAQGARVYGRGTGCRSEFGAGQTMCWEKAGAGMAVKTE